MIPKISACIVLVILLLTGLSVGGFDLAGETQSKNLSISDPANLGLESQTENADPNADAPQAAATDAGTELAIYSDQPPPAADQGKLLSADTSTSAPQYVYYDGNYLGWNDFSATFPTNSPGLWIERAAGWSWYATLPLGGWTRELMYVPKPSPLTMYEIYPNGYVMSYKLGSVKSGYYYIWFYADTPGRHRNVFATKNGYSNTVIIDVYSPLPPRPTPPSPKEQCEQNPICSWANGHCYCRGFDPDNPEKEKCEQNPQCDWVNEQCYCRGIPPDPEKEKCEQNPTCNWANGRCLCTGFIPDDNPEKQRCEQNPTCSWANGQCLCTGFNPPEPGPGPMPEPMPGPMPEPMPGPDPARDSCEQNPSCQLSGSKCYCMGLGESNSGDLGVTENLGGAVNLGSNANEA
ncbi:MAG: hypothetical protein MUO26_01955 [Methanotrichaceae archaeon]|nr:hypothetical protein [Methanotrichaceae archaeon]